SSVSPAKRAGEKIRKEAVFWQGVESNCYFKFANHGILNTLLRVPLQNMNDADRADAYHVRKARACVRLLPLARLASQLPGNLGDLAGAGGTDGMAHRKQSTRCADRAFSSDINRAAGYHLRALALAAEPHRFHVEQLLDGEGVVQFDHVELLRRDLRLFVSLAHGLACEFGVEVLRTTINPLAARN